MRPGGAALAAGLLGAAAAGAAKLALGARALRGGEAAGGWVRREGGSRGGEAAALSYRLRPLPAAEFASDGEVRAGPSSCSGGCRFALAARGDVLNVWGMGRC